MADIEDPKNPKNINDHDQHDLNDSFDLKDEPGEDLPAESVSEQVVEQEITVTEKPSLKVQLFKLIMIILLIIFICLALTTVYMKYSGRCNLLGNMYGNFVCRTSNSKSIFETVKTKVDAGTQKLTAKVKEVETKVKAKAEKAKGKSGAASSSSTDSTKQDQEQSYDTPALLVANNKLTITSLKSAKVKSLPYKDGQTFAKDDILVIFDCRELELDYAIQKAVVKESTASYENLKKLQSLNSANQYSVVEAESKLEQATKLTEKMEYQLQSCVVKADYAGKVISTSVTESEYANAGQDVMTVNNNSDLIVKAYVQASWLDWLKIGSTFKLCFVDNSCIRGVVTRIGAEIDATSQTIDVFGKLSEKPTDNMVAGLSGQVTFDKS